jgi:hypothetical protein
MKPQRIWGGGFVILAWSKCLNNEFTEDKQVVMYGWLSLHIATRCQRSTHHSRGSYIQDAGEPRLAGHLVRTLWDLTTSGMHKCTGRVRSSQVKIPSIHQSTESCRMAVPLQNACTIQPQISVFNFRRRSTADKCWVQEQNKNWFRNRSIARKHDNIPSETQAGSTVQQLGGADARKNCSQKNSELTQRRQGCDDSDRVFSDITLRYTY